MAEKRSINMRRMTLTKLAMFFLILFSWVCITGTGFAGDAKKGTKEKKG